MKIPHVEKDAFLSDCGTYRYWLTRMWNHELPQVGFCMLNPSTADANKDDPTIRRCLGYARLWGYGGLYVVNLFALRSTDPKKLRAQDRAASAGPENLTHIFSVLDKVDQLVCGWGNHGRLYGQHGLVLRALLNKSPEKIYALKINMTSGQPAHPLFLPELLTPFRIKLSGMGLIIPAEGST